MDFIPLEETRKIDLLACEELAQYTLEEFVLPLHRAGHTKVAAIGPAPLPAAPILIEGSPYDWWIGRVSKHPLWSSRRNERTGHVGFPIPAANKQELRRILEVSGDRFADLVLAEELPGGSARWIEKHGALPAELVTPAAPTVLRPLSGALDALEPAIRRLGEQVNRGSVPGNVRGSAWHPAALGFGVAFLAPLLAAGALAALATPVAALSLDPILFGVVTRDGQARTGQLACLVALTAWRTEIAPDALQRLTLRIS